MSASLSHIFKPSKFTQTQGNNSGMHISSLRKRTRSKEAEVVKREKRKRIGLKVYLLITCSGFVMPRGPINQNTE
jgi:hypothetical protein